MRWALIFFPLLSCIKMMITSWPEITRTPGHQIKITEDYHHVKINQNLSVISLLLSQRQKERNFCSLWKKKKIAPFWLSRIHWNMNLSSLQGLPQITKWMEYSLVWVYVYLLQSKMDHLVFFFFFFTLSYIINRICGGPSGFYSQEYSRFPGHTLQHYRWGEER